jgi:hypothetical protein
MIEEIEEIIEVHTPPGTAMGQVGVSEEFSHETAMT